jgi:RNA polymerase sigma-70 factor (ECF subfamily)
MLVQRYASDVYALCRAMVRDATLAEDLSQDAFSRAITSLDSFRGESSVRTWILKIARNRCLDHLARQKRDPFSADDDHDADDHPSLERAPLELLTTREDAARALASVGTTERALVVLHFGHGVGYPELSEAFGIKEGALRMRLSRALARMRDAVNEEQFAFGGAAPAEAALLEADEEAAPAQPARGGFLSKLGQLVRPSAVESAAKRSRAAPPPVPSQAARAPRLPPAPGAPPAAMPMPSLVDRETESVVPTLHESAPASLLDRLAALVRGL